MKNGTRVFTVTELTRNIRTLLEGKFSDVWVEGEISNFIFHTSGHMYFTLKDENTQIKVAMFKNMNQHLKFSLEDGLKVIVHGTVSVYDKRGEYQVISDYIEPAGLGALQLAFEQLKQKLEKEGLFDKSHKKQIPLFPGSIGIVTSPTGAAIRDMLNIIGRRFPCVNITIYPVRVQGEGASAEIAGGIEYMNELGKFDVLIVGRGGGSLEDLWAFNEEIVARAIYNSKIPVVSAVGHEIDYTIADFVADLRAPTPSTAAELVVQNREDIISNLNNIRNRLYLAMKNLINNLKERVSWIRKSDVFKNPLDRIRQFEQDVDDIFDRMTLGIKHILELKKKNMSIIIGKVNALNPMAILERGYSVCFKLPEKILVKSSDKLKPGDEVSIKLYKGSIECEVKKTGDCPRFTERSSRAPEGSRDCPKRLGRTNG